MDRAAFIYSAINRVETLPQLTVYPTRNDMVDRFSAWPQALADLLK